MAQDVNLRQAGSEIFLSFPKQVRQAGKERRLGSGYGWGRAVSWGLTARFLVTRGEIGVTCGAHKRDLIGTRPPIRRRPWTQGNAGAVPTHSSRRAGSPGTAARGAQPRHGSPAARRPRHGSPAARRPRHGGPGTAAPRHGSPGTAAPARRRHSSAGHGRAAPGGRAAAVAARSRPVQPWTTCAPPTLRLPRRSTRNRPCSRSVRAGRASASVTLRLFR